MIANLAFGFGIWLWHWQWHWLWHWLWLWSQTHGGRHGVQLPATNRWRRLSEFDHFRHSWAWLIDAHSHSIPDPVPHRNYNCKLTDQCQRWLCVLCRCLPARHFCLASLASWQENCIGAGLCVWWLSCLSIAAVNLGCQSFEQTWQTTKEIQTVLGHAICEGSSSVVPRPSSQSVIGFESMNVGGTTTSHWETTSTRVYGHGSTCKVGLDWQWPI